MIDKTFAEHFAVEWISAWNARDINRILSHYTDDFEMASPVIVQLTGGQSGTLKGKPTVSAYWTKALQRNPQLHFALTHMLRGFDSITLVYQGPRGTSAEVFYFNAEGKVARAYAHYAHYTINTQNVFLKTNTYKTIR